MEKEEEMDVMQGILKAIELPTTVKAGGARVYKKAKLTAPTIAGLRTPLLTNRIERYNQAYDRLIKIAEEMNHNQNESENESEASINGINEYNKQAQKMSEMKVEILAFDDLFNSKIRLDQPGVKAIRVPSMLIRAFNNFSIVSEKTQENAEEETNITDIAKSVISENENELTIDITNLEKVNDDETKNVIDEAFVEKIDAIIKESMPAEYELNNFSIEPENVYDLSHFSVNKAKFDYRLDRIFDRPEAEYELSNYSINEQENNSKLNDFATNITNVRNKINDLISNLFNKSESENDNEMIIENMDELIGLVVVEPTLYSAIKSIINNNYLIQKVDRDKRDYPDFIKKSQKLCVMHNNLIVDTSNKPKLVNLVLLANSWNKNCGFNNKYKKIFNKMLKNKSITDEEIESVGLTREKSDRILHYFEPANECYDDIRKEVSKYSLASLNVEDLYSKTDVNLDNGTYELSNFDPSKYFNSDELPPFDPNKWLNDIISGELDNIGTSNYLLSTFDPHDISKNEVKEENIEEIIDNTEEKNAEYTRLEKMFVNNEIALRFLTEELKDQNTGKPIYTVEDVIKGCADTHTSPLCLAIAIFQNLDRKIKGDILNRFTTKFTVLSGDLNG